MIGSVRGTVTHVGLDHALVEVGGIGYRVVAGPALLAKLRVGTEGIGLHPPSRPRGPAGALRLRHDRGARLLRAADDRLSGRTATGAGDHRRAPGDEAPAGHRHRRRRRLHLRLRRRPQDRAADHPRAQGEGARRRDRGRPGRHRPTRTWSRRSSRSATTATEARRAAGAVAATDGELDARIKAALQELARTPMIEVADRWSDPAVAERILRSFRVWAVVGCSSRPVARVPRRVALPAQPGLRRRADQSEREAAVHGRVAYPDLASVPRPTPRADRGGRPLPPLRISSCRTSRRRSRSARRRSGCSSRSGTRRRRTPGDRCRPAGRHGPMPGDRPPGHDRRGGSAVAHGAVIAKRISRRRSST